MRHYLTLFAAMHVTAGCYTGASELDSEGTEESSSGDVLGESGVADDLSLCEPGAEIACYSGPEGTLGVGRCAAGVRTCLEDGHLGRCEGVLLPIAEDCATEEDDDCNGSTACGGFLDASVLIPGEVFHAIAATATHTYLVWSTGETVLLGRFPEDGVAPVNLGSGVQDDAIHLDVDPRTGDLWLAATLRAGSLPIPFADDDCTPEADEGDVLLARFDPTLGLRARRCFGDAGRQSVTSLDVASDGAVLVAGIYADVLELPEGPGLQAAAAHDMAFVASIEPSLAATRWAEDLELGVLTAVDGPSVVAVADGATVVLGTVRGGFDAVGGSDLFVNSYAANGGERWRRRFGNVADQRALGVSVGVGGHLWIAGETAGQVVFGENAVGDDEAFMLLVARLDPTSGDVLAHRHVAGPNLISHASNHALAVGPDGEVSLAGFAFGSYEIGPFKSPGAGGSDAFLAKFGADATPIWNNRLGDASNQTGVAVVPGAQGLMFAGEFVGTMAIGDSWLTADTRTIFVLHFSD